VLDANILVSIVNSDDDEHWSCYSFFRNHDDDGMARWVVPGLIFFEFQSSQSRRYRQRRPGHPVFRHSPLNYENTELYHVTKTFLTKVYGFDLFNRFSSLRGQDLLYACIAYVEKIPLVTHDKDFDPYSKDLIIIKPRDVYGTGDIPLQTGSVSVKKDDKIYTVEYEVFRGVVRLKTGQATHTDQATAKVTAKQLLREIVGSGLADKLNLGKHV
jgi:hypothetical protein